MDISKFLSTVLNPASWFDPLGLFRAHTSPVLSDTAEVQPTPSAHQPEESAPVTRTTPPTRSVARITGPKVRTKVAPLVKPSQTKPAAEIPSVAKILDMIELYLLLLPDPVIKDDKNAERAIARDLKLRFPGAAQVIKLAVDKGCASNRLAAVPHGAKVYQQIMLSKFPTRERINKLRSLYPDITKGRPWPPKKP